MISDAVSIRTSGNGTAVPSQPGRARPTVGAAAPGPTDLHTSTEALQAIGHDLPYSVLHRWAQNGAVTPTQPAKGSGTDIGWSNRDILALEAIAKVRADLNRLGLPCPWKLVARIWNDLTAWDEAELLTTTVTISVRLGLEDQ